MLESFLKNARESLFLSTAKNFRKLLKTLSADHQNHMRVVVVVLEYYLQTRFSTTTTTTSNNKNKEWDEERIHTRSAR